MTPNSRHFYQRKEYRKILFSRVLCCINDNDDDQLLICTMKKEKGCHVLVGLIQTNGADLKENMGIENEAVYQAIKFRRRRKTAKLKIYTSWKQISVNSDN